MKLKANYILSLIIFIYSTHSDISCLKQTKTPNKPSLTNSQTNLYVIEDSNLNNNKFKVWTNDKLKLASSAKFEEQISGRLIEPEEFEGFADHVNSRVYEPTNAQNYFFQLVNPDQRFPNGYTNYMTLPQSHSQAKSKTDKHQTQRKISKTPINRMHNPDITFVNKVVINQNQKTKTISINNRRKPTIGHRTATNKSTRTQTSSPRQKTKQPKTITSQFVHETKGSSSRGVKTHFMPPSPVSSRRTHLKPTINLHVNNKRTKGIKTLVNSLTKGRKVVPNPLISSQWPGIRYGNALNETDLEIDDEDRATVETKIQQQNNKQKNLVCYYGTWAVYRPGAGKFDVENIDPFLCSHIIYGFTGLSYDNEIKQLDPWNDSADNYGKGAMLRFTGLKKKNPKLKTLVAIGGWNEGSVKYSKMASDPTARAKFIKSVVNFLGKYNFDGLDLDWEYPGSRGGAPSDKENYVLLLKELKQAFIPHKYLLTAAVSAGKWFIDPGYNIKEVSKYLDLINLMAYDYHGGWETFTGHNAPLFPSPQFDRKLEDTQLNVNWSVHYWLANGAPANKIMLGVGSYGRSFTLDRSNENGILSAASQRGMAGPYTREPGSLGYNEICEWLKQEPQAWTVVRDPNYAAPFAFKDRLWVGYDDIESIGLKAEFARSLNLGGVMMWSVETDDFNGNCNGTKFPLLNTIKRVINSAGGNRPVVTPTTQPPTTATDGLEVEDDVSSTTTPTPPTTTQKPKRKRPSRRPPTTSTSSPDIINTSQHPSSTTTTTTTTTTIPTTSWTQQPTTTRKPAENSQHFQCSQDGMFVDPSNCRKFIRCVSAANGFSQFTFDCPPGTGFSSSLNSCDHISNLLNCNSAVR